MNRKKRSEYGKFIFLVVNLIVAIFAFSFILSSEFVSSLQPPTTPIVTNNPDLIAPLQSKLVEATIGGEKVTGIYNYLGEGKAQIIVEGKPPINIEGYKALEAAEIKAVQVAGQPKYGSFITEKLGEEWGWFQSGGFWDVIISGAEWAGIAYLAGQLIGRVFGLEEEKTNALSTAMAAGFGTYKILATWTKTSGVLGKGLISWSAGIGLVVGLIFLELMWKQESKKIVTFEGHPWEAPSGGKDCEKCNSEIYPCTEYRCKSLGQACSLLNPGTGQEKCAWLNPKDVSSPVIQANPEVLTPEHKYVPNNAIRPPDRGVLVKYIKATDSCVKAFTPLSFGILLNEPGQCKIDYNRTMKYDEMAYYFGGSNIYNYNHTQILSLPGPDAINAEAPELKADGNYNLYVRCKDGNGNANDDLFVFSFCVEKGPDVTAPKIEGTSIANNMPFQYGLNETDLEVYVNEPAQCKWSKLDMDYSDMETQMTCSSHVDEMNNLMLYKCTTKLTGLLDRGDNIFYFKCKDQPWLKESNDRNTNTESYKFTLKGTQPLTIKEVMPNETIKGYTSPIAVYLQAETDNGYNYGDSWCSYSVTGEEKDYIEMYETGTNKHKQRLDLPSGDYKYYFQCVDLGGNAAYLNTSFKVEIDENPPVVVRFYKEGEKLKIITDEKSNCAYSNNNEKKCNFILEEGASMPYVNSTEHYADWKNQNYYIKCEDLQGRQPNPDECSIVVKPYS